MNKSASSFVQLVEMLAAPKVVSKPVVVRHPVHTLTELQQQLHGDRRPQHREWVEANGESRMCDFHGARLRRRLETYRRCGRDEIPPLCGNPRVGNTLDALAGA